MGKSATKAILYFARSPRVEARAKRWTENPFRDLEIARTLHCHTLHYLNASGLDVVHINEDRQRGDDFAERFYNALLDVFDMGYEHVIAVGNDQTGIEAVRWERIISALDSGRTVIGPDSRGGVYLLGLSKQTFEDTDWQHIPWQQSRLYSMLENTFRHVLSLGERPDLNHLNDIFLLLNSGSVWNVIRLLKSVLISASHSPDTDDADYSHHEESLSSRAPPVPSAA